jgi:hypothetical protein
MLIGPDQHYVKVWWTYHEDWILLSSYDNDEIVHLYAQRLDYAAHDSIQLQHELMSHSSRERHGLKWLSAVIMSKCESYDVVIEQYFAVVEDSL